MEEYESMVETAYVMSQPDLVEAIRQGDEDVKTVEKIKEILRDIAEHPYSGIGKPEPLRHNLTGKWSRRINKADRIIYSVDGETVLVYIFSKKCRIL